VLWRVAARRVVPAWLLLVLLAVRGTAAADAAPRLSGRLTGTFDGIQCEYSPGQEELARLLSAKLVARNREAAATRAQAQAAAGALPPASLSATEMRANRATYLAGINSQLGLKAPTPWQEECYDAFLDNYEQTMLLTEMGWKLLALGFDRWDKLSLWDRGELVRRLEAGEKIPGFSYDPVTKKGQSDFRLPQIELQNDRLKEIADRREKLKREYAFRITAATEGGRTYEGSVSSEKKSKAGVKSTEPAGELQDATPQAMPVVIPADLAGLPATEVAEKVWSNGIAAFLDSVGRSIQNQAPADPTMAWLILHETTEIGIIDHYYRGKDRRWFCDGVANYVPWRVVRDLHGTAAAQSVYDVRAQLEKYADRAAEADLRRWPAGENQTEEERESRLNRARYAFAAQAVFLMNARAGEDVLPRLFAEIGRTKPDKVSMATVEKAWGKVSPVKLDAILAEAVQPVK
jgi:hypothetical protein